jgi:hypothetical protein
MRDRARPLGGFLAQARIARTGSLFIPRKGVNHAVTTIQKLQTEQLQRLI